MVRWLDGWGETILPSHLIYHFYLISFTIYHLIYHLTISLFFSSFLAHQYKYKIIQPKDIKPKPKMVRWERWDGRWWDGRWWDGRWWDGKWEMVNGGRKKFSFSIISHLIIISQSTISFQYLSHNLPSHDQLSVSQSTISHLSSLLIGQIECFDNWSRFSLFIR